MNKVRHKICIAVVCLILGFLITYQFKAVNRREFNANYKEVNSQLISERDELKIQVDEYKKSIDELKNKISEFENSVANNDVQNKIIIDELEQLRILSGLNDVTGPGVVIRIVPKNNIFGNKIEVQPINDYDLVSIVNELNAAGAEAISINDNRIINSTGIRNAGNAIMIGKTRISYKDDIVIKAIGDKEFLNAALEFPGNIPGSVWELCDIKWNTSDAVEIGKSLERVENKYAKPIEKRGE